MINKRRRRYAAAFFVAFLIAMPAPLPSSAVRAQDSDRLSSVDFSRLVPGDVGFYVEVKGLSDLQKSFQKLGVWQALRDTVEGDSATSQPWQQRSEQLLGMTSEQLIANVLGHRAALFARRSDDWQNGILIAEIKSQVALRTLLQDWRARPLASEGPVDRYQLRSNLRCAVLDRILVLGPPGDPDGLWARSVLLLTGRGPHLAGQSEFASLRSRFNDDPDAVVFARWPDDYPYAFANCQRVLVTMQFDGSLMKCRVFGRRRFPLSNEVTIAPSLLDSVAPSSIAIWTGAVSPPPPLETDDPLTPSGPGALLHQLFAKLPSWSRPNDSILSAVGKCVLLQIGRLDTAQPEFPTLTITLGSTASKTVIRQLDSVFELLAQLIAIFANADGAVRDIPSVEHVERGDADVRRVDLGRQLARREALTFLRPMELAWTATSSTIVVGTSTQAVIDTLGAASASTQSSKETDAAAALSVLRDSASDAVAEFGFIRGGGAAALIDSWIEYARASHPELLEDAWWQLWIASKLYEETRLGVGMKNDPGAPGRAIVEEVSLSSPAAAHLRVGDVIVGIFGKRLPDRNAAQALAQRYERRGDRPTVTFDVIRDGRPLTVEIAVARMPTRLPAQIKPATAMKRLCALLKGIESASFARIANDPRHLDVRIRIRWTEAQSSEASSSR